MRCSPSATSPSSCASGSIETCSRREPAGAAALIYATYAQCFLRQKIGVETPGYVMTFVKQEDGTTTCENCGGQVRVVARIEDPAVIGKILEHLERNGYRDGALLRLTL